MEAEVNGLQFGHGSTPWRDTGPCDADHLGHAASIRPRLDAVERPQQGRSAGELLARFNSPTARRRGETLAAKAHHGRIRPGFNSATARRRGETAPDATKKFRELGLLQFGHGST